MGGPYETFDDLKLLRISGGVHHYHGLRNLPLFGDRMEFSPSPVTCLIGNRWRECHVETAVVGWMPVTELPVDEKRLPGARLDIIIENQCSHGMDSGLPVYVDSLLLYPV